MFDKKTICLILLILNIGLCQRPKRGSLIWFDRFDVFDLDVWDHLVTAWDGGNKEFQYYRNNRKNSYVENGILHIRPTLTSDEVTEEVMRRGNISEASCNMEPCVSYARGEEIIKPIYSARLRTKGSFSFKYGRIEVRAKMPRGDWIWPAIWFLPEKRVYGIWPAGGEIDLVEVRGNKNYTSPDGKYQGIQKYSSTLHFGPDSPYNGQHYAHFEKDLLEGDFSDDFHTFEMEWNNSSITYYLDGKLVGSVEPPEDGGFWKLGRFHLYPGGTNIWRNGELMAPFDQKFYIILNVAVGGNFFPDSWINHPHPKPWDFSSGKPLRQFWEARHHWMETWDRPEMLVDHILVYSV